MVRFLGHGKKLIKDHTFVRIIPDSARELMDRSALSRPPAGGVPAAGPPGPRYIRNPPSRDLILTDSPAQDLYTI
jgi:hypothetical protein